jgi:anti-sigma-K factor RskA
VTHQEFLDQVDAYALGALEPAEARALEQHLDAEGPHPLCEAALARAHETVATLAADLKPVAPPPHVWDGIARGISRGQEPAPRAPAPQQPPPSSSPAAPRQPPRRRVPAWTYGIAAAAVVAMIVSGVQVRQAWRTARQVSATAAECRRELAEARIDALRKEDALQLLTEAGTQLVSLKPSPAAEGELAQGKGVVLFNPRGRALFLGKSFPAQATRDYELWLIRNGKPIAARILSAEPDGRIFADVPPEVLTGGRPAQFAVSLEQKGGEHDAPKGPVFLTGAVAAP